MKRLNLLSWIFLLLFPGIVAKAAGLTDHQIMRVMRTANEGEIESAELAQSKGQNQSVKNFAQKMIDEHKQNLETTNDLAKTQKLDFKNSDDSKDVKKDASTKYKDLKKRKDIDFDRTYMSQQVEMHQSLLNEMDSKLIPQAQSPEVKSYLQATRSHVEEHLTEAKEILRALQ